MNEVLLPIPTPRSVAPRYIYHQRVPEDVVLQLGDFRLPERLKAPAFDPGLKIVIRCEELLSGPVPSITLARLCELVPGNLQPDLLDGGKVAVDPVALACSYRLVTEREELPPETPEPEPVPTDLEPKSVITLPPEPLAGPADTAPLATESVAPPLPETPASVAETPRPAAEKLTEPIPQKPLESTPPSDAGAEAMTTPTASTETETKPNSERSAGSRTPEAPENSTGKVPEAGGRESPANQTPAVPSKSGLADFEATSPTPLRTKPNIPTVNPLPPTAPTSSIPQKRQPFRMVPIFRRKPKPQEPIAPAAEPSVPEASIPEVPGESPSRKPQSEAQASVVPVGGAVDHPPNKEEVPAADEAGEVPPPKKPVVEPAETPSAEAHAPPEPPAPQEEPPPAQTDVRRSEPKFLAVEHVSEPEKPLACEERLQEIFMTEERVSVERALELCGALPGIRSCILAKGTTVVAAHNAPTTIDLVSLTANAAALLAAVRASSMKMGLGEIPAVTIHSEKGPVSFFHADDLAMLVLHADRGFVPGVRERLHDVVAALGQANLPVALEDLRE